MDEALSQASGGKHVFLEIEEQVRAFDCAISLWEQMFADQQGRFQDDKFHLTLGRVETREDGLIVQRYTGSVVAQLRYEYALNLLNRLGGQLSRVGLDFQHSPLFQDTDG